MNTNDIIEEILKQIKQPLWENWYIKEKIGAGAFSAVYKVEAKRTSRRTSVSALKIEPITSDGKPFMDDTRKKSYIEQKLKSAENEAEIMYSLRKSPYIVSYEEEDIRELYINNVFEGYYYLIRMEYLKSISDLLYAQTFDLSENNILKLAINIGKGIKAAHNIGVIHRDIKLDNFFVDDFGTYKLGDFNISKKTGEARTFAGTHGYLAPEIFRTKSNVDEVYTNQADIYAFGICLYQFMNNLLFPFEDICDTDTAIDRRMNGESLPNPKNASEEFSRIILKACAYELKDRYTNISELIDDLNVLKHKELSNRSKSGESETKVNTTSVKRPERGTKTILAIPEYYLESEQINKTNTENGTSNNIIEFGNYFLSNSNYKSPIKWRILSIENDQALLISQLGIDTKSYNDTQNNVTWSSSEIRKWLNNEFLNTAFSQKEKQAIIQSKLINNANPVYGTTNGENTIDSIFLLSLEEVNKYFRSNNERTVQPTELAVSKGLLVAENGNSWWWLRSSGNTTDYAADVDYGGDVDSYGSNKVNSLNLVRPAMRISLERFHSLKETSHSKNTNPTNNSSKNSVNSALQSNSPQHFVPFGNYFIENANTKSPIVWKVLSIKEDRALLITEHGIDCLPYNNSSNPTTWENSTIRHWLNNEFLSSAFNDSERNLIFETQINTPNNSVYMTDGGNSVTDKVFLLTIEESKGYFRTNEERIVKATNFAKSKGLYVSNNGGSWWWLRSSGNVQHYMADVDYGGDVDSYGSVVTSQNNAVRPAIWVDIKVLES